MMAFIEKLKQGEVLDLRREIPVEEEQVSSKTLVQRPDWGMSLFSLDTDEEIGGHSSPGDAMVNLLSGVAEITIGEEHHRLHAGQCIVMPANVPHALKAIEAFQMLLVVVKPEV